MRKYIVETYDGEWQVTTSTPLGDLLHPSRRVKDGLVTLVGKVYALDPRKMRRMPYRPKRFLWLVTEYAQVQLWKEDEPEPVDLFDHNPRNDDRSGAKIATLARSERLRRLVEPKMNIMMMLLLLSIVGNIILGAGLFYLQRGGDLGI